MSINDENNNAIRSHVLTTEPKEDVGSDTFSRFHYQAEVTAQYCLIDVRNWHMTYARAGHPYMLLFQPDGSVEEFEAPAVNRYTALRQGTGRGAGGP